ncbi:MAG: dTDP-4-dehydrorhamnose reductase [Bacteroidota bacterium]|nr:dTDP-4-dehydrorhamnose reductase [Bacteroidota bacterium]MDP4215061.1 dTDP-4-dehydrorhamnose reductase [Bacteroidota bacterium]MDP4244292.1 dTDP-4-dehydrorhamnose reductase [Bacteroidota bacterium]MDP4252778.1 dTDP-4-dehydrorhamnose reductase [Bacteroidota bacterium]MDP4257537.1 dTDP-4-dehydrorhamnose reductase [Bacteroidota bacterium]
MDKIRIIVTGANGQLGRELQVAAHPAWADFVWLSRADLSIEDVAGISRLFHDLRPAWCINCAAYTAVDKAEAEKEAAFRINGQAVGELAAICKSVHARLLHISTDYVFDGHSATPLKEGDPTGPLNVYGASKLLGERLAMENNDNTVIVRTSWVYSSFGSNFVKTMMRLMREKESLRVVDDQIGSPTYAADLADALIRIATGAVFVPGIYHYSNMGQISWYEFALAIKELTGSACRVEPVPASQYPTPARRPHFSLLDKSLIQKTYGLQIPAWRDSLVRCLHQLAAT